MFPHWLLLFSSSPFFSNSCGQAFLLTVPIVVRVRFYTPLLVTS